MDKSDPTRRTLSDALRTGSLGDEARDFLAGAGAGPEPAPQASLPGPEPAASTPPPNPLSPPRHPTTMTISPTPNSPVVIPAIVAMTFRLPASLAARLLEVASARKLRRERPFHQQEIVAEALGLWLRKHGLDRADS